MTRTINVDLTSGPSLARRLRTVSVRRIAAATLNSIRRELTGSRIPQLEILFMTPILHVVRTTRASLARIPSTRWTRCCVALAALTLASLGSAQAQCGPETVLDSSGLVTSGCGNDVVYNPFTQTWDHVCSPIIGQFVYTADYTGTANVDVGFFASAEPSQFDCVAGQTYTITVADWAAGFCIGTPPPCDNITNVAVNVYVTIPIVDCNQDGLDDACELSYGIGQDINHNDVPDECEAPHCVLATLTNPEPGADDRFGYYVATDGVRVLVGSYTDDGPAGVDQGSASVYRRDGVALTLEQTLTANDAAADDRFGVNGLAIRGDVAVIGAYRADAPASNSGAVYVFKRNLTTGVWAQKAKLVASDGNADDDFGYDVKWSGNLLFVSAITKETPVGPDRGKVYVFQWNGSAFSEVASLYAPDGVAFDLFGSNLDFEAGRLVAAADAADTTVGVDSGAAYVFKQNGGAWTLEQKLLGHYPGARAGTGLSIEGDLVALGQPLDADLGANAGWVTIWKRDPLTSVWSWTWSLVEPDTDASDEFGRSVLFVGNKLFIGAPFNVEASGSGTVYCRTFLGSSWTKADRLHPGPGVDGFGVALDWAHGLLATGAYATAAGGVSGAGAVVAQGAFGTDCNANLLCDFCDIQAGTPDPNGDGVLDACDPWTDMGGGVAGLLGLPMLGGSGALFGGDSINLSMSNAKPNSTMSLLIGFLPLGVPFKGGTMVPNPNLMIFGLPTGPAGALTLHSTWSNGLPSGVSLYFQEWISDAAGPAGFAATNGLKATTP